MGILNVVRPPKSFVIKIILAVIVVIVIPVIINKLLLKDALEAFTDNENLARAVRGIFSGLILAPAVYAWFFAGWYREKLSEFKRRIFLSGMVFGSGLALIILLSTILILGLSGYLENIRYVQPTLFWYGLIMILVLAVTEELFFRGIFYRVLEERFSCGTAIVVTALLFAASHLANDHFTVISIFSVVAGSVILGLMYTFSRSLWMPVFFHFTWNMIQVILGLPVSGSTMFFEAALFDLSLVGPPLLTGGEFGLENSLVIITMLFASSWILVRQIRKLPPGRMI
jgi:hypothetical protein